MSRLTDLLRQARTLDPQLATDLESEVRALLKRRTFGLVFERHQPEAVELPGRTVRRGDKVRILPPRGALSGADARIWHVERIEQVGDAQIAHLSLSDPNADATAVVQVDELVVTAEFRDRIYPGLVERGRVERGEGKPFHTVINGENFHALQLLTYTHREKVDCIYIDPPYNTGARDWKYNNDYVEAADDYRHSKWLAFMERRLTIARDLLKPGNSVVIVTIDEKEVHRLGLLLEQVFPEARIQMVSIVINHNGATRSKQFSRTDEYAFFCFFGDAGPERVADPLHGEVTTSATAGVRWEWLMRGGSNSRRVDRPNLFYPVFVDEQARTIAAVGDPIPLTDDHEQVNAPRGTRAVWPIRASGEQANWRTSHTYLRELLANGYARLGAYDRKNDRWSLLYLGKAQIRRIESGEIKVVGRDGAGAVILEHAGDGVTKIPGTTWNRQRHNAGEYGSRLVKNLVPGVGFTFPKSLYAVEDALRVIVGGAPDAVILDFFAGSGTTAHAVMRLNRRDGGRRQCISITNNEVSADEERALREAGLRPGDPAWEQRGICDSITTPRIKAAITGKTGTGSPIAGEYKFIDESPMSDGFEENAAFFTLTYEQPLAVRHHRAFRRIAPMLWLRAGAVGPTIMELRERGWATTSQYGVLLDMDASAGFLDDIAAKPTLTMAFIVTDDDSAFQMVCRNLPDGVEPVRLYESYLSNFEINAGAV